MEKTDEALVAEYLAGDESVFATLVQRHLKSIYSFALRSVGDEAEDVVQDTFLKVWKNIKTYEPRNAQFKTWLMSIARNTVIDYLRKKKSFVFSDFNNEQGESFIENIPDSELLPDESVAQAHDARDIKEVLEKLSAQNREVILLRFMNHMTFEEISEVLGEPLNTVKSRSHRGLLQLRQYLEATHQKET